MAIRVDIDETDLHRLHRETATPFSRDKVVLASACAILTLGAAAAAAGLWRSFEALQFAHVNSGTISAPAAALGVSLIILIALCGAGLLIFRMRGKRRALRRAGSAKRGLTTGRFEFLFTDAALVVKGAQTSRRASWACLDKIAETKSNIVFWRRGEVFAFLPIDTLKDPALYEKLQRIHGPSISNKLSCGKDSGADPHCVSFECTKRDYEEYRQLSLQRADALTALMREFFMWRAWPPILFFLALLITGLGVFAFAQTASMIAGAIAAGAACADIVIFRLNSIVFRGPAFPFQKPARWPYAEADLTSLALSESGVCVSRSGVEETYPWVAFDEFIDCPLTAYLRLTPLDVLPVPKRAFLDKVHFQAFAGYARAHIKAAGKNAAAASQARLARQLAPARARENRKAAPKPPPTKPPVKAIAAKPRPKALPPVAAPKTAQARKKPESAIDAVRLAAKARAAAG